MNLDTYFDKIIVISLKRDRERRQHIENEFRKFDAAFEYFDGIDALAVSEELLLDEYRRLGRETVTLKLLSQYPDHETAAREAAQGSMHIARYMTPGALAASLSHLLVCELIQERGYKRALICEDDFAFRPNACELWENIQTELKNEPLYDNWDVIHLASFYPPSEDDYKMVSAYCEPWGIRVPVKEKASEERQRIQRRDGTYLQTLYRGVNEYLGCCLYAVSGKAVSFLLKDRTVRYADALLGRASLPGGPLTVLGTLPLFAIPNFTGRNSRTNEFDRIKLGFTKPEVRRLVDKMKSQGKKNTP